MTKKVKSTRRVSKRDPVKKFMDKLTRPSTHIDKKKEAKKNGDYYE